MTTEKMQKDMTALQDAFHPHCIVCGGQHNRGLKLSFQACDNGGVEGRFTCSRLFQGYEGFLHGGVISALLDGAMTNCLFACGKTAMTGELTVRFLFPALVDCKVIVRAWIKKSRPPLHTMESELQQAGRVVARATAKFMEVPDACIAARNS
ncbi:MAG: PaaI family thioesterase [Kiritimatiellae bacterium]|nr:PaaI family thioesterase [Kiritimatiellia bacterium]